MSPRKVEVSSRSARRERLSGGQVLTVGESPALDAIVRRLVNRPRTARNLFDGLGELAAPPAGQPIAVVVISADLLDGSSHVVAESFRQVDPSVELFVAMDQAGTRSKPFTETCLRSFDGLLRVSESGGVSDEDLRRLPVEIRANTAQSARSAFQARPGITANGPATAAPATDSHVGSGSERTPSADDDAASSEPQHEAAPVPAEIPEPPVLGDTDLVAAILSASGSFLNVALTLIAQQTTWTDIALLPHDEPVRPAAAAPALALAEVEYGGHRFGRLATALASPAELSPWADWLAHWLGLSRAYETQRALADRDDLTGALNRRAFKRFLRESIDRARAARRPVTVMVYDIDDFKQYNDTYGHAAGDDILRETVKLLNSVIRRGDRVFRIGGDEFAVVFADPEGPRAPGTTHPENIEAIARRFQDQICRLKFPKLGAEAHATLSISAGLAAYPWDGNDPETLLDHADRLALQSKQRGKNALTLGPGARTICGGPHDR